MASSPQRPGPVVVIGSGPAGACAATFLAEQGIETLVLEAGSQEAKLGFTARLRGFTFAKLKPPLRQRANFSRLGDLQTQLYEELAPGGLSNHWSCAVPRFSEQDFQDAERAGEQFVWPLTYRELVPWYDRVERLLHIAAGVQDTPQLPLARASHRWRFDPAWQAVEDAALAHGRSLVVMPYANGARTLFTRSGTAFNAFSQLVVPAMRAGRMSVRFDAHVSRLEWSADDKRVVAVVFRDARSGAEQRQPCRAVVLAAGAVNSAQILLQSTSPAFPYGLGNEHDVLGRYLHDHPIAKLVLDFPRAVPLHPASYITRPALGRDEPLYAAAGMQWCGSPALVRSVLEGRPGKARQLGFSIFGTMVPRREDFVALDAQGAVVAGQAPIIVSLEHPPEATRTLERTRDDLLTIFSRAGWEPRIAAWNVEPPGNSVHYGGTCRMHVSPSFGVVDAYCRVHNVPNVGVADSSVFTTGPEKNPVLTAMALAARTSSKLADDLRASGAG